MEYYVWTKKCVLKISKYDDKRINSRLGLDQEERSSRFPGWIKACGTRVLTGFSGRVPSWLKSVDAGSGSGAGPLPQGSPEETNLLRIVDKVPKHNDEIAQEANMTVQHAAALLLELELRGLVSQVPGKYFISGYWI